MSPLSVTVCVLQTETADTRAKTVQNLFSYVPSSGTTPVTFSSKIISAVGDNQEKAEYAAVKSALSAESGYTIFILDTSVSTSSPQTIYEAIAEAIKYNTEGQGTGSSHGWDLCYLCKWLDNCSQFSVVGAAGPNTTGKIAKTISPYGFQAVLFSPSCIAKMKTLLNTIGDDASKPLSLTLHDQVGANNWKAFTFTPNLVNFDVTLARNGTYDYVKSTECRDPLPITAAHRDSNTNFFWFVITFFMVILFTYFLIVLGPRLVDWLQGAAPVQMCFLTPSN
jgi:hypothetical protein